MGAMHPMQPARPHILGPEGQAALARTLASSPLLAFDFDGTLAPIVALPSMARMPAAVSERLGRIAARVPVAIVTGREVADVRQRLDFEPRYIVGSHGAEGPVAEPAPVWVSAMAVARDWLQPHRGTLEAIGVQLEDKRSSIALHYRNAPDRALARRSLERLLRTASPALHVFGGKMVFNIVPAHAPDKADAVLALVRQEGAGTALFVGDDLNDEPVFQRAPAHWLTIKVGPGTERSAARSAARFFLAGPSEVADLLDAMLGHLGPAPSL